MEYVIDLKPEGAQARRTPDPAARPSGMLEAFKQARAASRRARKCSPREAVTDRKVQASVRRAGASLGRAAKRIQRESEPPRRMRKVLVGMLVLAGLGGLLVSASKWPAGHAVGRRALNLGARNPLIHRPGCRSRGTYGDPYS